MNNLSYSEISYQGYLLNIEFDNDEHNNNINLTNNTIRNVTDGINFNSISQITLNQPSEAMQRIKFDNTSSTTTDTKAIKST
jgi:hypothetical protein